MLVPIGQEPVGPLDPRTYGMSDMSESSVLMVKKYKQRPHVHLLVGSRHMGTSWGHPQTPDLTAFIPALDKLAVYAYIAARYTHKQHTAPHNRSIALN